MAFKTMSQPCCTDGRERKEKKTNCFAAKLWFCFCFCQIGPAPLPPPPLGRGAEVVRNRACGFNICRFPGYAVPRMGPKNLSKIRGRTPQNEEGVAIRDYALGDRSS